MCILYYEGEKLPEQRAELYRKFVENLVKRRFDESDRILEVLKGIGFTMQESEEKSIGRYDAIDIVKQSFIQQKGELECDYNRRINKLFDDFEPRCGLLRLEDGHYRFWHLTFQEYLAAEYLLAGSVNPVQTIESYLTKEHYTETVRLYIGCLSLNHKTAAAQIIRNVLERKDASSDELLLVGEALVDIKRERRDDHLVLEIQARYWKEITTVSKSRKRKVELGEIIGWLGDKRDLTEFVTIKGGEYDLDKIGKRDISSFEIGKYPVTNQWYGEFINDNGYLNKEYWSEEGWKWKEEKNLGLPKYWNDREFNCPNLPVVGVSWYESEAFANWLNTIKFQGYSTYTLFTEEQWLAAAAGFEKRVYPWGNDDDCYKCNCYEGDEKIEKTSPVGILLQDNTPEGVTDMAGNVLEWCADWYIQGESRVVRGGSWYSSAGDCRSAYRSGDDPGSRSSSVGFRLSRGQKNK